MSATSAGTARFAARFESYSDAGFYRTACGLTISSLGLGTFLGEADEATDSAYTDAVFAAISGGINLIDTALNYRHQRSELSIRAALQEFERDEVVICSKAGFLVPDAIPKTLARADVVGGTHSMAPDFLADQIDRSRANLGVDTLDVFYLHNPETQLPFLTSEQFDDRLRRAFERLEQLVAAGVIGNYGAAAWEGFRMRGALSMERMAALAGEVAGPAHHFRFIQLPFNLGMVEAYVDRPESALEMAARLGLTVIACATLMQARVLAHTPDPVKAIQFTRSTPGIAAALVGMSNVEHVCENLGVAAVAPLTRAEYDRFYQ